jgi:hypothetical protein
MRKVLLACLVIGAVLRVDAAVLDKKGMADVKKVALISLCSTKRVLMVNHEQNQWVYSDPNDGQIAAGMTDGWFGKVQAEDALASLYQNTLKIFETELSAIANWEYIPYAKVASTPAYKSFKPLSEMDCTQCRVADGMTCVKKTSITDGTRYFGNMDPFKPKREALALLARDLNVDAVLILEVRTSYRYGKLARFKYGENVKGIPRIGAWMMGVSKDGKVVIDTGEIKTKLQDEYEGDSVSMVKDGTLLLGTPEVQAGYTTALSGSATRMREILQKAFDKLK